MHLTAVSMGGLLGSALAMPHFDHSDHHLKKKPEHYSLTGTAPAPTAGPCSLNSTAGPTGLPHYGLGEGNENHQGDEDVMADVYVTKTFGTQDAAAAEATLSQVIEDKHKIEPEPTNDSVSTFYSSPLSTTSSLTPSETSREGSSQSSSPVPTGNPEDRIARPVSQAPSSSTLAPAPSESPTDTNTTGSYTTSNGKPTTKPTPGLKGKRGIISSGDNSKDLPAAVRNTKVVWLGNWYSGSPNGLPESVTFVPQMYGRGSEKDGEWERNAKAAIAAGDKVFFSFGEPGTPNKDRYMTPEQGADFFRQQMEPYAKQGVSIGAPGTLQNKQDFDWLEKFLAACNDCSISFLQQHWFDKAAPTARQVEAFKGTVNDALKIADGKYPVWVENFQASGTAEDQKAFLKEVVPWLESNDQIQGYGYVPGDKDSAGFMDGDTLNDLGSFYADL